MPELPPSRRRRRRWRLILLTLLVLALLAGLAAWFASSVEPAWYQQEIASIPAGQARKAAARPLEDQLPALQSWADATYVHQRARSRGRNLEVAPPAKTFTLELSEAELNAFVAKWMELLGDQVPAKAVAVQLQEGSVRVGLKLPQWSGDRVLSISLQERANAGQPGLDVSQPRVGLLPLPLSLLPNLLPAQRERKLKADAGGKGNEAAVIAGGVRLAQELLAGRLQEDRCFLPLATPIAVRVQRRLEARRVQLTFTPLDEAERQAYLAVLGKP